MKSKERTHKPADALDWEEALRLIRSLYHDGHYRDSMLIAAGCHLGLRISDLRWLTWGQLCAEDGVITLTEQKTGKKRTLKVNRRLREHSLACRSKCENPTDDTLVFNSTHFSGQRPISRQQVANILNAIRTKYRVRSAKSFSSHSMRKTFGRRVWTLECERGRGDQALLLLCDVFGHSNTAITKRYLGIRQDEILSVYDSLDDNPGNDVL